MVAVGARRVQSAESPVRIGVLTDLSGPYRDSAGPGSVVAARMAAQDFGGTVLGRPIEIVSGDTQNKPDVASTLARAMYDNQGVGAIIDLPVTPIALAVQQIAREKNRTVMITDSAVSAITAKYCTLVSTHWCDDTHAITSGTKSIVGRGADAWYFITVDTSYGTELQDQATARIVEAGGKVVGSVRHAIGETDFASPLLSAQSSGAKVVALATVGGDLVNILKQAHEFGYGRPGAPTLAGFTIFINDVHALGLPIAQGFEFVDGFYWDQSEQSRAFAKRFFAQQQAMPSKNQGSIYAAVTHYLNAVRTAGTEDAAAVGRAMRANKLDYFGRPASVRQDGRVLYDLTLYRTKTPEQSKYPWDYCEAVATVPSDVAFLAMNPSCSA